MASTVHIPMLTTLSSQFDLRKQDQGCHALPSGLCTAQLQEYHHMAYDHLFSLVWWESWGLRDLPEVSCPGSGGAGMRSLLTPSPVTYLESPCLLTPRKQGTCPRSHTQLKELVTYWNILCALSFFSLFHFFYLKWHGKHFMNINVEYMIIRLSNQSDQVKAGSAPCLFRRGFLAVNRKHPFLVYLKAHGSH